MCITSRLRHDKNVSVYVIHLILHTFFKRMLKVYAKDILNVCCYIHAFILRLFYNKRVTHVSRRVKVR